MLCETCLEYNKDNKKSYASEIMISHCEKYKDLLEKDGFINHKITYDDGYWELFRWCEINGWGSTHSVMHNIKGPAWNDHRGEHWCYYGNVIPCCSMQNGSKVVINKTTNEIGTILKPVEGKIYKALFGNKIITIGIENAP